MQECHKELLSNTQLGVNMREQNLYRGLTKEQYLAFKSFLDNDLDDGSETAQERREEEEPQINDNLDIEKEELENKLIERQNELVK